MGSNPSRRTLCYNAKLKSVAVAQLVRAPLCESGGRGFKSRQPPQNMTKITYTVGSETASIFWGIAEEFSELRGKTFLLNEMAAAQLAELEDISLTAKILLSAVAGAVIQHLMDKNIDPELIFSSGSFVVE